MIAPTEKMDPRVPGLVTWAQGGTGAPYTLDISPTDWCNLACRSCWMRNPMYNEDFPSDYQLSDDRLLSIVDEAAELGIRHIEVTGGGEPLMRKKAVLRMMERIKSRGLIGSMTTNGTLWDEGTVQKAIDMGWDRFTFSVDGADRDTNNFLRPFKSSDADPFARITATLQLFKDLKAERGTDRPQISFNVVLSKKNAERLADHIRLAANLGVHGVNFEPLTIHSETGGELRLSDEEVRAMVPAVQEAVQLAADLGVYTNAGNFIEGKLVTKKNEMPDVIVQDVMKTTGYAGIPCYEPWYHLVVKTDGSVGPCCIFDDKAVNVKTMSLREIWTGVFMSKVRTTMEKREFLEWCEICNAGQVLQNRGLRSELKKELARIEQVKVVTR